MANTYATLEDKKLFDGAGGKKLWKLIRARYDSKLDEVLAADQSITITDKNKIAVQISDDATNLIELKTTGDHKGIYVPTPAAADTYTITKMGTPNSGAAASYKLQKFLNGAGEAQDIAGAAVIDIPKDMVVQSGTVETKAAAGAWGEAGTYLHLVLANAESSDIYINVNNLIEYVTSGSKTGDMIVVDVSDDHKVTATITDGTVTKAKLHKDVQDSLDLADSAVQEIKTGETSGTINVDGTDVKVKDIDTAAYKKVEDFDAAGAAAAVLGKDTDSAATATVYGVKEYASEAYTAIKALTDSEIEALITAADQEYEAA